jgi:hypothetical protein
MYIHAELAQDIKEYNGVSISTGWYTKAQLLAKSSNADWKAGVEEEFFTGTLAYSVSGNTLTTTYEGRSTTYTKL